jgi:hypothetical protein
MVEESDNRLGVRRRDRSDYLWSVFPPRLTID